MPLLQSTDNEDGVFGTSSRHETKLHVVNIDNALDKAIRKKLFFALTVIHNKTY